jgi:hypothetical protein
MQGIAPGQRRCAASLCSRQGRERFVVVLKPKRHGKAWSPRPLKVGRMETLAQ